MNTILSFKHLIDLSIVFMHNQDMLFADVSRS